MAAQEAVGETLELAQTDQGVLGRAWSGLLRFIRRKPLGALAALVLIVLFAIAASPSTFAPNTYEEIDLLNRLKGPTSEHIFGSDKSGRDIFSRVLFGARTSVSIGFAAVAIAAVLSSIVGISSGYYGGKWDLSVQRFVDIVQAFPGLIFIIFLFSIFTATVPGSFASQVVLALTLGFLFSAGSSRVVRSQTISTVQNTYVEAARVVGATNTRIMVRHVFPNVFTVIIINISVQLGAVILIESALSFLGYGVQPPYPSWGRMLQEAQEDMLLHPYLAFFPGFAIALSVYALNMFGDALRDVLDPRLRGTE
ncbi:MAG: ABC transporter permease [Chloroflexi bacterium]|nr:ABC transporter permease [Chloroflexota bacterium]